MITAGGLARTDVIEELGPSPLDVRLAVRIQ